MVSLLEFVDVNNGSINKKETGMGDTGLMHMNIIYHSPKTTRDAVIKGAIPIKGEGCETAPLTTIKAPKNVPTSGG